MANSLTNKEGLLSNPSTLIELFELDGTSIGLSTIYRFYDGTNNHFRPVTFNSVEYMAWPMKVEGYEYDGKGSLPRPKLTFANINGFVSNLLLQHDNLIWAKVSRIRVYARFLDASNFVENRNPFGTPDPTAGYPADIFYINRKITETTDVVQFELATRLEIDDVKLPNRPIFAVICPFRFRDPETCGYQGAPVADRANKTFLGAAGYNFSSLTDKGEYSTAITYNAGDYVYVTSVLPQTLGEKLYYVCNGSNVVGETNSPIRNSSLWLADSCSNTIAGCKLHFPNTALRGGFFPGVTRGNFIPV